MVVANVLIHYKCMKLYEIVLLTSYKQKKSESCTVSKVMEGLKRAEKTFITVQQKGNNSSIVTTSS